MTCDELKRQLQLLQAQQAQFWNSYQQAYNQTVLAEINCVLQDVVPPCPDPGPPAMVNGVPFGLAAAQNRLNQLLGAVPQTEQIRAVEQLYQQVIQDLSNQDFYYQRWISSAGQIAFVKQQMAQQNCGTATAQ